MNWPKSSVAAVAVALFAALALSGTVTSPAEAAGFQVLSPSASDFPQHVDWVTVCHVTKHAHEDPIVFPGMTPSPHDHTFSGNTTVNASSTAADLVDQPTNCTNSGDTASYWMPSLLVNGTPLMPYMTRAYYRAAARDTSKLHTIPFGLKMVAGDAMATSPQSASVAGFQCRIEGKGATVSKQALPPQCGPTALLEASVVFPNCWDGKNLDSADHRAHMSYAKNFTCDAAHPVQIPQLTLAERFTKGMTSGTLTLAAMNSPLTLHADFINAWKPAALAELMKHCIYAHVFCEDVSDTRMPPGMTTTVPAGQSPTGTTTSGTTTSGTTTSGTTSGSTTSDSMAMSMTPQSVPSGTTASGSVPSDSKTAGSAAPATGHASHAAGATTGPVITPVQMSGTRVQVVGTGFASREKVTIVLRLGSHTRSIVAFSGHDGGFTAFMRVPGSWAGTATVTASAGASVLASATVRVR